MYQKITHRAIWFSSDRRTTRQQRCYAFLSFIKSKRRSGMVLVWLLLLAGCGGNSGAGWGPGSSQGNTSTHPTTNQGGLIILASPTLQFVLPALTDAFFAGRGQNVPYVFDFSGARELANTVNAASDADLLITDDPIAMRDARNIGFTQSSGTLLATDTLTVVFPASNPGKITSLQDLTTPGLRYLGISASDGLNAHIQGTLESMLLDPTFGQSYAARVYGNLVANYTDGLAAAHALAVPTPPGDFSIVYQTNYLRIQTEQGANALLTLPIPTQFNPPIPLLAAITGQSQNTTLVQQFIDFMRSAQATPIWTQFGFVPAS